MSLTELLDFHIEINKLKQTQRYSSCREAVRDSVADHSWSLAFLALDCIDELELTDLNPTYCAKLALAHDLGELKMNFDFDSYNVARGRNSKQDKDNMELETIKRLAFKFGREDIYELWTDFEEGKTPEAKYLKALDKIEALKHLIERGDTGRGPEERDHVVPYADEAVLAFPKLKPLLREVKQGLKKSYEEQGFGWKLEYDKV